MSICQAVATELDLPPLPTKRPSNAPAPPASSIELLQHDSLRVPATIPASPLSASPLSASPLPGSNLIDDAKKVFALQSKAIAALAGRINSNYTRAINLLLGVGGHVVVTGMGKSGLIAQKIAATLVSTGTPSFFLHPADALHGDLGLVKSHDVAILISYSGETSEVIRLVPHLRQLDVPIIGLVADETSTLGRASTVTLDVSVEREVCPNNLAPTNSTLATLAMGDSLAVSLMRERNFQAHDFALFHPGGTLGRRLLTKVKDTMHGSPLPIVTPECSIGEGLLVMTHGQRGLLLIVDDNGVLAGIITDGDLRRGMQKYSDLLTQPVQAIMSHRPVTIDQDAMLAEAEERMVRLKLSALVVVGTSGRPCGIIDLFSQQQ